MDKEQARVEAFHLRAEGKSYLSISRELAAAGFKVSSGTVGVWCDPETRKRRRERQQVWKKTPQAIAKRNERIHKRNKRRLKTDPKYRAQRRKSENKRRSHLYATDPKYRDKIHERRRSLYKHNVPTRLADALRSRLRQAIKRNAKAGSAVRDLGCTVAELRSHLESLFQPGMDWDNHGSGWHIDHKIPLASFDLTNREEFLRACHWSNLQPLWAEENLRKGDRLLA